MQELTLDACTSLNLRFECPELRSLALPHSKVLCLRGSLPALLSLDFTGALFAGKCRHAPVQVISEDMLED